VANASGPPDALGLVGSTVDQVRFDACVDAGGFGLIYRGYHQGLGETVAIKCLRIASIQKTNEEMREALAGRFRDETKLLYRLSQGNLDIVRCMSSGTLIAPTTKEYTPYMILEWLEGSTLSVDLKERRAQKLKPRSLDAAVTLLDSAVGALAYAHANDVVHRDVKPGNLFLTKTREGVRMKVLDFGLAKILDDDAIGVRPSVETGVGVHFCSPSYGAPEQYSAQVGKIGPWTDVYSLTLVLLEVLTGDKVRPAGTLAEGLIRAMDKKTGSPTASSLGLHLPQAVEDLLLRGVAQNPLERPRDAGVFWSALKEAIASAPKSNLAAATVMDDGMGDAMLQVRAAAARQSTQPPPFAGTMLMQNAPGGAPHLGRSPGSTPQQPVAAPVPSGRPGSVPPGPMKMTVPIGSMSPLAASMALQHRSPSSVAPPAIGGSVPPPSYVAQQPPHHPQHPHQQPHLQPPQHAQQAQLAQQSHQPQQPQRPPPASVPPGSREVRTDPRTGAADAAVVPTSSGGLVGLIIAVLILAGGFAFYWFRMRGD
jgi:eukaryotic-like serine/threonine-protein kinase